MLRKVSPLTLLVSTLLLTAAGCGVPKTEHEKIVTQLSQVGEEMAALSDQLERVNRERAALAQRVTLLEEENRALRAKIGSRPALGQ